MLDLKQKDSLCSKQIKPMGKSQEEPLEAKLLILKWNWIPIICRLIMMVISFLLYITNLILSLIYICICTGGFSISYYDTTGLRMMTLNSSYGQECDEPLKTIDFTYGRRANFVSIDGTAYLVIIYFFFSVIQLIIYYFFIYIGLYKY